MVKEIRISGSGKAYRRRIASGLVPFLLIGAPIFSGVLLRNKDILGVLVAAPFFIIATISLYKIMSSGCRDGDFIEIKAENGVCDIRLVLAGVKAVIRGLSIKEFQVFPKDYFIQINHCEGGRYRASSFSREDLDALSTWKKQVEESFG